MKLQVIQEFTVMPGWYIDPENDQQQCWWDGRGWTNEISELTAQQRRERRSVRSALPTVAQLAHFAPPRVDDARVLLSAVG